MVSGYSTRGWKMGPALGHSRDRPATASALRAWFEAMRPSRLHIQRGFSKALGVQCSPRINVSSCLVHRIHAMLLKVCKY